MADKNKTIKKSTFVEATFGTIDITIPKPISSKFPDVKSANDVYTIAKNLPSMKKYMLYKEIFYAFYINASGKIIAIHKVAEGGSGNAPVDGKFIAQGALLSGATTVIVCHNHPSEKCEPSNADVKMTNNLKKGLKLIGIRLYDHVIITRNKYCSLVEKGLLK